MQNLPFRYTSLLDLFRYNVQSIDLSTEDNSKNYSLSIRKES